MIDDYDQNINFSNDCIVLFDYSQTNLSQKKNDSKLWHIDVTFSALLLF